MQIFFAVILNMAQRLSQRDKVPYKQQQHQQRNATTTQITIM